MDTNFKPQNDKELWYRDTYALCSQVNFNSLENYCGMDTDSPDDVGAKVILSRDWGIDCRADLDETLEQFTEYDESIEYALQELKETDLEGYNETLDILSRDLCNANLILGMAFACGIIDRDTMAGESGNIGRIMQLVFSSWEELTSHYIMGFSNWADEFLEPDEAKDIIKLHYDTLELFKQLPNPPFSIDWNLELDIQICDPSIISSPEFHISKTTLIKYLGDATCVTVPDGVKIIGRNAFEGNTSITEVILPSSTIVIDDKAFFKCTALSNIVLPDGLLSIGEFAFSSCSSLENIDLPESLDNIDDGAFSESGLVSCIIPSNITYFSAAFFKCYKLKSVTFPSLLEVIGDFAFTFCQSLTEITLPENLRKIGCSAFADCSNLSNIICEKPSFAYDSSSFTNSPIESLYDEPCAYYDDEDDDELISVTILSTGFSTTEIAKSFAFYADELVDSSDSTDDNHDFIFTLKDNTELHINTLDIAKNSADFEVFKEDFIDLYSCIDTSQEDIKSNLLSQLALVTNAVKLSFNDVGIPERVEFLVAVSNRVARDNNSIFLIDGYNLIDADGKLIFNLQGESDLDAFQVSPRISYLFEQQADPTPEDELRYSNSRKILAEMGIPFTEDFIPYSLRESSVNLRSVQEICERIVALYTTGLYSLVTIQGDMEFDEAQAFIESTINIFNSDSYFSRSEQEFMCDPSLSQADLLQKCWNFESVGILLWAIGLIDTDNSPSKQFSQDEISRVMQTFSDTNDLISHATLRSTEALLQQQDLFMRYNSACFDANSKKQPLPPQINHGISQERHRSLNWLLTTIFGPTHHSTLTPA